MDRYLDEIRRKMSKTWDKKSSLNLGHEPRHVLDNMDVVIYFTTTEL